ncbi:cysteine-rich protein 3 isoform X2 [Myotis lucifugus]|uniref:cysteine-rich protein 3 isoform X2 n=1 Tax=Myotis lucifugus TaxID=59463 RepID=UPI000CCC478A|nr:cysteine-rich protein 3 isoform X2 [Myotis lucifugus]
MQSTMGGRIATSHAMGFSSDPVVSTSLEGDRVQRKPSLWQGPGDSSLTHPLLSAGVNIGGVGSYLYNSPILTRANTTPLHPSSFSPPRPRTGLPQRKKTEKVMSLGRNWHRPCLRCQRCRKTLTAGSHAEHDGVPYCHIPCYGYLFGPKGVNIGDVGCYIYDPVEIKSK